MNKTLGLLGAGQTARLLALAALRRGLNVLVLDPMADAGTRAMGHQIIAGWDDQAALQELGRRADLVGVEPETVPADAVQALSSACPLYPPADTLVLSQDRLRARQWMQGLEMPQVPFLAVASRPQLLEAVEQLGFPCVLKTRRWAVDGKLQAVLRFHEDLERAWQRLGEFDLICERFVRCDAEYALTAARGRDGKCVYWPLTRKLHRNGALAVTMAPVMNPHLQARAERLADGLLDHLGHVGVFVLELFSTGGDLLVNEFVPGPHDSAHWTIDGAPSSQFDNHLNALFGAPLGEAGEARRSVTFYLSGSIPGESLRRESPANAAWHDYRMQPLAGCKLGHVTVTAKSEAGLRARAAQLAGLLGVSAELDLEAILS
ncbi:MAG: ATP-grasp domain-containing protein [Lysobacterales bacterium]